MFRQFLNWGYKALKWDFLYHYRYAFEELRNNAHDKSMSLAEAFAGLTKAASETVGKEIFMLYCALDSDHDLDYMQGNFNADRIGGDVFNWREFTKNVCARLLRYYPFHNTSFYADGDNLVLRKKYNNEAQVRSRCSLYGIMGLPVTIGDAIDELDEYRVHCLRRIMPVVNMTPRELKPKKLGRGRFLLHASFARKFGTWEIVGIMNPGGKMLSGSLKLKEELGLPKGEYAVYDFWNQKFLGIVEDDISFETQPKDTTVLRITPVTKDRPCIIASSRHITQGGFEFENVICTEKAMQLDVKCVEGETEKLSIYLPSNLSVKKTSANVKLEWKLDNGVLFIELLSNATRTASLKIDFL